MRITAVLCALTLTIGSAGLTFAQDADGDDDFHSLPTLEGQWQRGLAQAPGAQAPAPHQPLSDNAQVDRAAHELGADELHTQGLTGAGETIVVVDNRAFSEQSLLAPLGDHYRLQVEITQQVWAPEAQVQGLAAVDEGGFLLSLAEGVVADVLGRPWDQRRDRQATVNVATQAVAQAPDDAVISWVATMQHLSDAEVRQVVETLGEHTEEGGSVVIGSGAFSADQLRDPQIAAAIAEADLILVDVPRYDERDRIVASGQSLPTGAGDLATISVPTTLGHGSVAVPEVAGALALVRQAQPSLNNAQILALIEDGGCFTQEALTQDGQHVPLFNANELLHAAQTGTCEHQPVLRDEAQARTLSMAESADRVLLQNAQRYAAMARQQQQQQQQQSRPVRSEPTRRAIPARTPATRSSSGSGRRALAR